MTSAPEAPGRPGRGTLLRWIGWFGIANAALYGLVGLRYLLAFGTPDSGTATVYVALAFIGQFALLGFLPLMLLLGPLALLLPRKGLLMIIGVPVAAAGLTILALDTNVFAQYRYHMSALTARDLRNLHLDFRRHHLQRCTAVPGHARRQCLATDRCQQGRQGPLAGWRPDPRLVRRPGHPYLGGRDGLYAGAGLHALHARVFPDQGHTPPGQTRPDRPRSGGKSATAAQGQRPGQRPAALSAAAADLRNG